MSATQLDLLSSVEPYSEPSGPTGRQHALVLTALLNEGARGLTGEEVYERNRDAYRDAHVPRTRLHELLTNRDRWPVPLVCRSERKERADASGVKAYVWRLTDEGRRAALRLLENQ